MIAVSAEFVSAGACSSSCFGISLLGRLSISLGSAAYADSDLVVIGIPFYSNVCLFNFKCDWVGGGARRAFAGCRLSPTQMTPHLSSRHMSLKFLLDC